MKKNLSKLINQICLFCIAFFYHKICFTTLVFNYNFHKVHPTKAYQTSGQTTRILKLLRAAKKCRN